MRRVLLILMILPFLSNAQIITTIAGGGATLGDGSNATAALINNPGGMAFDKKGNLYIASGISNRIRKIDTFGIITTIAGTGVAGYSGDGGQATAAQIKFATDIAIDSLGNIWFTDTHNFAVRKINTATGIISTICGNGVQGVNGDNGPASAAQLYSPDAICFDKFGNLYIAEGSNHVIRKINPSGIITTIAGTGIQGYNGDLMPATATQLNYPVDVETDNLGNIYISDQGNYRIRKINPLGIVSTYAGNGDATYGGDGMIATNAQFIPTFIKFDLMYNLYVTGDRRVSKIDPLGVFHKVIGDGSAINTGDGGMASSASIYDPLGLAIDKCNNLYVSLRMANKIRKVTFNPPPCDYLAVDEQSAQKEATVYPNPANDELHIENAAANITYALSNVWGAVVETGRLKKGSNVIAVQQLPPGLYMLLLTDEEGKRMVHKVVKE